MRRAQRAGGWCKPAVRHKGNTLFELRAEGLCSMQVGRLSRLPPLTGWDIGASARIREVAYCKQGGTAGIKARPFYGMGLFFLPAFPYINGEG